MDEWSLQLTAEQHLAPSTIRSYQCSLRLFTEFTDRPRGRPPRPASCLLGASRTG
jgi:hypothetical protein